MTQNEFTASLSVLTLPVSYEHAKKGTHAPYINYTWNSNSDLFADDIVYTKKNEVKIELVCVTKKDINYWSEKLEKVLENISTWVSDEDFSDKEQLYIKNYYLEV